MTLEKNATAYVGIDIAKKTFDAAIRTAHGYVEASFDNRARGWRKFKNWLKDHGGLVQFHLVMEATGVHHLSLAIEMHELVASLAVINPRCAKAFADSKLRRTKTDPADARGLADYGAAHSPTGWVAPSENERAVKEMARRVKSLTGMISAEKNRLADARCKQVKRSIKSSITSTKKLKAKVQGQLERLIQSDPVLRHRLELIVSIPGIGMATATSVVAELGPLECYQKARDLGYTTWFQPSVGFQRAGPVPSGGTATGVIRRGDVLWTDFGVVAMNLHTDTQHLGYVMREGETDVPEGLKQCLANSNRLQDILLSHMEPGLTGNEVLANTLAQMRSEGINGTDYTHPIGDHGHGTGPLIGRWDAQEGVPVRGDAVMLPNVWHSIELQATTEIPEWDDKPVSCRQEEEAYLDQNGDRHWAFRRQSRFHLVW